MKSGKAENWKNKIQGLGILLAMAVAFTHGTLVLADDVQPETLQLWEAELVEGSPKVVTGIRQDEIARGFEGIVVKDDDGKFKPVELPALKKVVEELAAEPRVLAERLMLGLARSSKKADFQKAITKLESEISKSKLSDEQKAKMSALLKAIAKFDVKAKENIDLLKAALKKAPESAKALQALLEKLLSDELLADLHWTKEKPEVKVAGSSSEKPSTSKDSKPITRGLPKDSGPATGNPPGFVPPGPVGGFPGVGEGLEASLQKMAQAVCDQRNANDPKDKALQDLENEIRNLKAGQEKVAKKKKNEPSLSELFGQTLKDVFGQQGEEGAAPQVPPPAPVASSPAPTQQPEPEDNNLANLPPATPPSAGAPSSGVGAVTPSQVAAINPTIPGAGTGKKSITAADGALKEADAALAIESPQLVNPQTGQPMYPPAYMKQALAGMQAQVQGALDAVTTQQDALQTAVNKKEQELSALKDSARNALPDWVMPEQKRLQDEYASAKSQYDRMSEKLSKSTDPNNPQAQAQSQALLDRQEQKMLQAEADLKALNNNIEVAVTNGNSKIAEEKKTLENMQDRLALLDGRKSKLNSKKKEIAGLVAQNDQLAFQMQQQNQFAGGVPLNVRGVQGVTTAPQGPGGAVQNGPSGTGIVRGNL